MRLLAQERRTVAHLEEMAHRAVRIGAPTEQAVADLQRISPDPVLLGVAAGRASGRWAGHPAVSRRWYGGRRSSGGGRRRRRRVRDDRQVRRTPPATIRASRLAPLSANSERAA